MNRSRRYANRNRRRGGRNRRRILTKWYPILTQRVSLEGRCG